MSYPSRQLYPTAPPGWAPIPYQGAPPPIPHGYAINQQQWAMGHWQPNPNYNPSRFPAAAVPWMPGQHWQQFDPRVRQQQQQANFNPYKKVIKPPSAEYLAMPLSDNPLGLHDMIEAENRYQDEKKEPQTPWIWNPLTLSNDATPSSNRNQNFSSAASVSSSLPSRHASVPNTNLSPSTPKLVRHATEPSIATVQNRESFTTEVALRPTFSSKIVRTPDHYAGRSPLSRHNSASGNSITSLSTRMERMATSDPTRLPPQDDASARHGSMYTVTSCVSPDSVSGVSNLCDEPRSMPGTTTSPSRPIPRSRGSHGESNSSIGSATTLHTIVEDTVPRRKRSHKKESSGHELDMSRSPPRVLHHPNPPGQQHTPPDTYPSPHRGSYPFHSETGTSLVSPASTANNRIYAPPAENLNPLPILPRTSSSGDGKNKRRPSFDQDALSSLSSSASVPLSNSSSRNKLPTPPQPVSFNPHAGILPSPTSPALGSTSGSSVSSASVVGIPNSFCSPPSQIPGRMPKLLYVPIPTPLGAQTIMKSVRKGFWNRRGDHLTHDGYVVYAPPDLANPDDLCDYPDGTHGYQDEFGRIAEWDEQRPELEASLPVRGGKPEKPYRNFIVFVSKDVVIKDRQKERERTPLPGEVAASSKY